MIIARNKTDLKKTINTWKSKGHGIGFVPTMGALHDGHLSLVQIAKQHATKTIASIFVNPAQFAPHEDFDAYPRDEKSDIEKFSGAGVDMVYMPQASEIYPNGVVSDIKAGAAAQGLESDFRPHFFDGVLSVVSRLFDHVRPDSAIFGEKDFQQLSVIREFVAQKNLPIQIIGGPIIRDEFGLALSSRNAYLSETEISIARKLNLILKETKSDALNNGKQKILAAGFDEVQYLEMRWGRILTAVILGKTRLIDNLAYYL